MAISQASCFNSCSHHDVSTCYRLQSNQTNSRGAGKPPKLQLNTNVPSPKVSCLRHIVTVINSPLYIHLSLAAFSLCAMNLAKFHLFITTCHLLKLRAHERTPCSEFRSGNLYVSLSLCPSYLHLVLHISHSVKLMGCQSFPGMDRQIICCYMIIHSLLFLLYMAISHPARCHLVVIASEKNGSA